MGNLRERAWRAVVVASILGFSTIAWAQTTQRDDAAALYLGAVKSIVVYSPSNRPNSYTAYPPFPSDQWVHDAKAAWDANGPVRDLAREARSMDHADWPPIDTHMGSYLNGSRAVANDLADAAEYEDYLGDHAGAVERIEDIYHLADLVRSPKGMGFIPALVSAGINALADYRLMVIASDIPLTNDPADKRDVQVPTVRALIQRLLDGGPGVDNVPEKRVLETFKRVNMEGTLTAMSLACHLFKFDNGHWPDSAEELVPTYLSRLPIDSWGNGKETLGYVVIQGGLPDGLDRPMVYSRCQSLDGLLYRMDDAQYGFYSGDGTNLPRASQLQGGQFRDVARWTWGGHPPADVNPRALP